MAYKILTNEQLDLASSFERFQQRIYGNVLIIPEIIPIENGLEKYEKIDKYVRDEVGKQLRNDENNFGYE